MLPKSIRVVFLDAGGTLFRPYPSVGEIYASTARKHGLHVQAKDIEHLFAAAWRARNGLSSLAGATSDKIERDWWYGLVRDVFAPLGSFADFEAFFADLYDLFARAECWRLFEDAVPTLAALKKSGYRLAMISNWDHRLMSIVEELGLLPYFEKIYASSAVGVAKPGAGIFHKALEGMGVEPAASVHVGDSLADDYQGALNVGMQAVWLERSSHAALSVDSLRDPRAAGYNGVVRIQSLQQLPALLS